MANATSPATGHRYGVTRVCQVWDVPRSPRVREVVVCLDTRNEGARITESGSIRTSIQGPHCGAAAAAGECGH